MGLANPTALPYVSKINPEHYCGYPLGLMLLKRRAPEIAIWIIAMHRGLNYLVGL